MKRANIEKYYLSMAPIQKMFEEKLISKQDYQKAESFLAEQYCINKGNLYRLNDLTILSKRVIYVLSEEDKAHEKNHHQTRCITEVSKKD
jgi:hypothetical protein